MKSILDIRKLWKSIEQIKKVAEEPSASVLADFMKKLLVLTCFSGVVYTLDNFCINSFVDVMNLTLYYF